MENTVDDKALLAQSLQLLLADTLAVYLKAHGMHWNVTGPSFFMQHQLFEEIYQDFWAALDDIAESIRRLDVFVVFNPSSLAELSNIRPSENLENPAQQLFDALRQYSATLTRCIESSAGSEFQGILNMLADRQDKTQKYSWFLRSTLQ